MTANTVPTFSNNLLDQSGIAFDFSPYFDRIAIALETIANNSTHISANVASIANNISNMDNSIEILKNLGSNNEGIHVIGPYDWFSMITVYKLLVEQGKMLDTQDNVSAAEQAQSNALIDGYSNVLSSFDRFK